MSADLAPALDRATLLATLVEHDVEFVLVGGVAGQAYGATRVTKDLDLFRGGLRRISGGLRLRCVTWVRR